MLSKKILKPGFFRGYGKPKATVRMLGYDLPKWESIRVENNAFSVADSFDISLPWDVSDKQVDPLLSSGPDFQSQLVSGTNIPVEVYLGFTGEPTKRVMFGKMDVARWNFGSDGEVVSVIGRNLTGQLIDTKTTEKYQNLTASKVAEQFFIQHGLTPQVTKTNNLIGTYLNKDQTQMERETTQWDLLLWLSQEEGFVCRVIDDIGYFGPRSGIANLNAEPLVYTWGLNILDLEIERGPHAARNLVVEVVSWHGKQRIAEKATSRTHVEEKYTQRFTIPGLTREQAQKRARSILEELSAQEMFGRLRTDWIPEFGTDRRIALHGVGLGLSQIYYVTKVTVQSSLSGGIEAELSFVNNYIQDAGRYSP